MNFTQAEQDIREVARIDLWNGGYVSKYDFSKANSSEAHRVYAVTTIANVCRGDKGIKDREALYQQLLTEHAGKPGEVFQFVPVKARGSIGWEVVRWGIMISENDRSLHFQDNKLLTNLRAILPFKESKTLYNDSLSGFHVFKMKIPKMIVAHLLKHGQLSFMQQSERHCKLREYYYCDELKPIDDTMYTRHDVLGIAHKNWDDICYELSQSDFDIWQKTFKIRQELTNKGSWGLGYTTLWMAGWEQDTAGWDNFFAVRTKKPAQREIIELAKVMKQMMEE